MYQKQKGVPVDMNKVKEIAANNSIQVSKAVVKENGDVYVNLPTEENREKLVPLLGDATFAGNEVVTVKSKLPAISINNVSDFTSKEDIEKVKRQNPHFKERMVQNFLLCTAKNQVILIMKIMVQIVIIKW